MKKNIIFVGWVNQGKAPVDGETTKNQYIIAELKKYCEMTILDFYEKHRHPWIYAQALWALLAEPKATIIFSTSAKNVYAILRLFKFLRYSRQIQILVKVLKKEKKILFTVLGIAVFYIFVTALIMFNVESTDEGNVIFTSFFDALYWATTTLTTVGYGDIYPVSEIGRFISMLSSLLGVAVIALPSGVITASYLDELREEKKRKENHDIR